MKVKLDESQVVPWCKCIAAAALAVSSNSSMQAMASVCPGARKPCWRRNSSHSQPLLSVSMIVTIGDSSHVNGAIDDSVRSVDVHSGNGSD